METNIARRLKHSAPPEQFHARIPPALMAWLRLLASDGSSSVNALIVEGVEHIVEERKRGATRSEPPSSSTAA
jgi:predicted HicB family RNase H-like nuclease